MTLGEKLSRLRKQNNYTQEQLADILGVSRQAVSKWESDISYPETEKIIQLGKLYQCSMDYLLKDEIENEHMEENGVVLHVKNLYYERVSKKKIKGVPLWHINMGTGRTAKGIIAIGIRSKGIISIGVFSMGIISVGIFSMGILAIGIGALGLIAAGNLALGLFAMGAIALGIVSMGAIAVGEFAAGAMAIGRYVAVGDYARAAIAVGQSEAYGDIYQKIGKLTAADYEMICGLIRQEVPGYFRWAGEFMKSYLKLFL